MFETTVNQIVRDELITTEFYNGTLFVRTITEQQARQLFHKLSMTFGVGTVQVSPIGNTGEYAYDFVAKKQQTEDFSPFATVNS